MPPPGDPPRRDRGGPAVAVRWPDRGAEAGPWAGWDPDAPHLPRPPEPNRLCGPAPVRALFARRPQAALRLFFTPERADLARPFCAAMARARRPYREVAPDELARIAGTAHHGGIVAVAQARFAEPLARPDALPDGLELGPARLLPVLDGIGNPHNLGAVARSAAFFGCAAMLLSGDPRQADLSDAAFRTAEGGLEHLRVLRARDLPALLRAERDRLLAVAAVAADGAPPAALLDRRGDGRPIALMLGNEEAGPPHETLAACEARVTLPGSGAVESLNVAAAAAVLIHALAAGAAAAPPPRSRWR